MLKTFLTYPIIHKSLIIFLFCTIIYYINTLYEIHRVNKRIILTQKSRVHNYKKDINDAKRSLDIINSGIVNDYRMHELYYNGVPDTYSANGTKIRGIKPDPQKALFYLSRVCETSLNSIYWFKLAGIYQHGMYNLEPDLNTAQLMYNAILQRFQHPTIQNEAQDRLNEVVTESNNIHTYGWLNLIYKPKNNQHHDKIKSMMSRSRKPLDIPLVENIYRASPAAETQITRAHDINNINYNDRHNTHNSQVVGTVAHSLKTLKNSTKIQTSIPETLQQIRSYISSKPQCDKTKDAYKSLDSIERNIIPITSIDMKECEALNVVWNRINSDRHKNNHDDIKEILYTQLADMQEHGKSVCASGRLSRIIDTFSTFDSDVSIKPTYIINKEMMEKAGKMREDMYENYNDDLSKQLRSGTAPKTVQDEFDKNARNVIVDTLTKDYVDTGIMTDNAFTKTVDEWIDEI